MPSFSAFDSAQMARALRLAGRGEYTAQPNPMVGCVLQRDGRVIGEGWHRRAGEAHAEINALENAGDARGATAYVTLEPCAHHGRTPPCADALVDAAVAEVIFALPDPYAEVDGRGRGRLEAAGITVKSGLMQAAAEELNRGYLRRVREGRPWVTLKMAASLDGAIAMASGESHWITGEHARADVQRLRARSGAVLTGVDTVVADDPSLTVRDPQLDTGGRQPLRVVLDSQLRIPADAAMLDLPGQTLVFCVDDRARPGLEKRGAEVVTVSAEAGRPALDAVLAELGRRQINHVLVEAGPTLAGSLLDRGLTDELVIYQAPHIMGSETKRMLQTSGWEKLSDRRELDIVDVRQVGADTRITARLSTGKQ